MTSDDLDGWLANQPDGPWVELLREGIAEYALETGGAETPVEHFTEWLAEWGRDVRRQQRGLLLLTAHRAKGLEFDHVVVLDGGWNRVGMGEDADAPRRLYYVAMTRARQTLTLMRLPGVHPFQDALRSDPAVLHQVAVGMGAVPTGEGVGRETGVHQHDGRLHRGMVQLRVEAAELVGGQHSLVDHGAVRHAGDVELLARPQSAVDPVLQHLADDVEPALERLVVVHAAAAADVELADVRLHRARGAAQGSRIGGQVAPAEQHLPMLRNHLGGEVHHLAAQPRVRRQEAHAYAVGTRLRQLQTALPGQDSQRGVGNLQQRAGTVPRIRLGAAGAAMVQVREHVEGLVEQLAGLAAVHVDDEPDPARLVLIRGMVQPLLRGNGRESHAMFRSFRPSSRAVITILRFGQYRERRVQPRRALLLRQVPRRLMRRVQLGLRAPPGIRATRAGHRCQSSYHTGIARISSIHFSDRWLADGWQTVGAPVAGGARVRRFNRRESRHGARCRLPPVRRWPVRPSHDWRRDWRDWDAGSAPGAVARAG